MKYFIFSDIHGEYDKLMKSLAAAGFDITNPNHTLVSLGDPFDRGKQSLEMLKFIMSAPRRIIVLGNHDWRLSNLTRGTPYSMDWPISKIDVQNGLDKTLESFGCRHNDRIEGELYEWRKAKTEARHLFDAYVREAAVGLELGDYLMVHGWVPVRVDGYRVDNADAWYRASWADTQVYVQSDRYFPHLKTLVIGHWWAYDLRRIMEPNKYKNRRDNSIYYCPIRPFIAIVGCTNSHGGKANVLVIETDQTPNPIKIKLPA